jgi:phosphoribosylanthranilate isomerase
VSEAQAVQTILGAGAVIVALIAQSMIARRFTRNQAKGIKEQVAVVQETVNGKTDALHDRIDQLGSALTEQGIDIPEKPPREDA